MSGLSRGTEGKSAMRKYFRRWSKSKSTKCQGMNLGATINSLEATTGSPLMLVKYSMEYG